MRAFAFLCAAVGLGLAGVLGLPRGDAGNEAEAERVAGLIRQLGDARFARREAASKELEALGEKALGALRRAAAASVDPEIRRRAETLIAAIGDRLAHTDVKSAPPPKGALILFDGKHLDAWVGRDGQTPPTWRLLEGGVMEARGSDIRTRQTFAEGYTLHVEFRVPHVPGATDPARGNSGVYLHGRYEVQILDSHGLRADATSCGAIYGLTAPRVNACKAPGAWQSYDIEFRPPRFRGGKGVASLPELARLTVLHNGTLIHDKVDMPTDETGGGLAIDPAEPGPVMLQYHGSPVQFRNLWLLPSSKR